MHVFLDFALYTVYNIIVKLKNERGFYMKRILSIILTITLFVVMSGCSNDNVTVVDGSDTEASSQVQDESDISNVISETETKTAVINLNTQITNSEYCDMRYTMSIPDWEFEKDRGVLNEESWVRNYTRMYKSDDPKLKFFVTEYFGREKYPGQIDDQFGESLHTEARAVSGCVIDDVVHDLTGYTDNYQILNKEPIKGINGESYYEFCLQCPNKHSNFYYAKGYVAVGIEHPIAVYFFDKTIDTIYDDDMINKSLEIIKTLKIED